jgi:hypothetical protein
LKLVGAPAYNNAQLEWPDGWEGISGCSEYLYWRHDFAVVHKQIQYDHAGRPSGVQCSLKIESKDLISVIDSCIVYNNSDARKKISSG